MSASLVGSEMCIRDSHMCHGVALGQLPQVNCRGGGLAWSRRQRTRGGPVSYTHLTLPTICSV
eukprot:12699264-Alexandrium_andersonii.AAC.1